MTCKPCRMFMRRHRATPIEQRVVPRIRIRKQVGPREDRDESDIQTVKKLALTNLAGCCVSVYRCERRSAARRAC